MGSVGDEVTGCDSDAPVTISVLKSNSGAQRQQGTKTRKGTDLVGVDVAVEVAPPRCRPLDTRALALGARPPHREAGHHEARHNKDGGGPNT
jgi:hypothetical protein